MSRMIERRRSGSFQVASFTPGQGSIGSPTNIPAIMNNTLWDNNLNAFDDEAIRSANAFFGLGTIFDGVTGSAEQEAIPSQDAAAQTSPVTTILIIGTVIVGILVIFKVLN